MTILCALLLGSAVGTGLDQIDPADQKLVAGIPLEVDSVVTGGYWKDGEAEGRFRLVVINEGWEHIHSLVYAQWLETQQERGNEQVFHTVQVKLDPTGYWSVGAPVFLQGGSATQVRLDATDSISGKDARFLLVLRPGGKYEARRAEVAR